MQEYGQMISTEFPKRENLVQITGNIQGGDTQSSSVHQALIGYQFKSSDNNVAMQARLNGFSYSFLNETYTVFENFKPKAIDAVTRFMEFTRPISVLRCSLRFINQIKIPIDQNILDYVPIAPNLSIIPKRVGKYLLRSEFYDPETTSIGVLTHLMEPDPKLTFRSIYLDIDVILHSKDYDSGTEMGLIDSKFDKLREFKNDIFFSSLSEKAIKMYV